MDSDDRKRQATISEHHIFLMLGVVFLTSGISDGDLASYAMGTGLLVMGILSPGSRQSLLGASRGKIAYIAAAVLVIVTGIVQVGTAVVEAVSILQSGTVAGLLHTVPGRIG